MTKSSYDDDDKFFSKKTVLTCRLASRSRMLCLAGLTVGIEPVVLMLQVQMGFVVCLEEETLTLADCWSEQFKIQRINLVKILQGSQGPSDAPED